MSSASKSSSDGSNSTPITAYLRPRPTQEVLPVGKGPIDSINYSRSPTLDAPRILNVPRKQQATNATFSDLQYLHG